MNPFDFDRIFGPGALVAAIGGAFGGLVRWLALREHWTDGAISILVGAVAAVYLSPVVTPIIAPALGIVVADVQAQERVATFVTGLGGVGFIGFIIDTVKAIMEKRKGASDERKGT